MRKVIAITNQKGGVGKTTTAVNLAAALGKAKQRTLLIDVDPQGNTTSGLGINKRNLRYSVYDFFLREDGGDGSIISEVFKNLDVLPSSMDLAGVELELAGEQGREDKLNRAIFALHEKYDYIIIDCPPSIGLITVNALCASDSVIIPIQCEFYALEGLTQLMNTIKFTKRAYNTKLELEGILLTMYDNRLKLTQQVEEEVKKHFSGKVFDTKIPRTVKLSEAPSYGAPVIYYDRYNKGSRAYINLCKEILKRNKREGERK